MSIIQQRPASKPGDKQHWGELRAAGRALAVAESAINFEGLTLLITERRFTCKNGFRVKNENYTKTVFTRKPFLHENRRKLSELRNAML